MNRNFKSKMKLMLWFLVLVNIVIIFVLTFQDAVTTTQLSSDTRDKVVEITNTPVEVARHSWWYVNIRKLGHIPEYLTLGVTTAFAWYATSRKLWMLKAFLMCVVISLSDQLVKGMLPTREFDATDLPFDLIGYGVGILFVMFLIVSYKLVVNVKKRKIRISTRDIL